MFKKTVVTDCMERRVLKYYSTRKVDGELLGQFENYGQLKINEAFGTFRLNSPSRFSIQGILDGYQLTVTLKTQREREKWENKLDDQLGVIESQATSPKVYLDYNSTTPMDQRVVEEMIPWLEGRFANPSSQHSMARDLADSLWDVRLEAARLMGCSPQEVIFTSGGTESISSALWGRCLWEYQRDGTLEGRTLVISDVEHTATLRACENLKTLGLEVQSIPVDQRGVIDLSAFEKLLGPQCLLVSLIFVNNELGTIQPLEKIFSIVEKEGVPLHLDAVQGAGKIPLEGSDWPVQMMSLSAHKFYGPKGMGLLYLEEGFQVVPLIAGSQQRGRRGGTENTPGLIGLGKACHLAWEEREKRWDYARELRDYLLENLQRRLPEVLINGDPRVSVPNVLNLSFPGISGDGLLNLLDERGICLSRGSACASDSSEASHVLRAIGLEKTRARNSLRFSWGKDTTSDEILYALEVLEDILNQIKE